MSRPLVDAKCYELAEYFMSVGASEDEVWALAKTLQDDCEDASRAYEATKEPALDIRTGSVLDGCAGEVAASQR